MRPGEVGEIVYREDEILVAVVPADPAAPPELDYLTGWAAGKLASGQLPGLVVLGELPGNASGQVLKHELRARYGDSPQNGGSSE